MQSSRECLVFIEWLLCLETEMACKTRSSLLLLDQCSAYSHNMLELRIYHQILPVTCRH